MSRVEKNKKMRKFRRKIIYPLIGFSIFALFLIFVVDHRVNSVMGETNINILNFYKKDSDNIEIKVFGEDLVDINTVYLKKDFNKIKFKIRSYVGIFEDKVREVMKEY